MGNEISVCNSITYYKREFCGESEEPVPAFSLEKVKFMENHDIEETSIVSLFVLDTNRDGRISCDDIEKFIRKLQAASLDPNDSDFGFKCGAFCTKEVCTFLIESGDEAFKRWFEAAIRVSFSIHELDSRDFIDGDAVKRLFDLLQIQALLGRNFQWILDMLQRHAEANLTMNLNDPAYDDLVPIETMLCLVQQICNGMVESYKALTKQWNGRVI
jgi:hypothetical protein